MLVLRPLVRWLTRPIGEGGVTASIPAGTSGEIGPGMPVPSLEGGVTGGEQITQLARADAKRFAELLRNWISKR